MGKIKERLKLIPINAMVCCLKFCLILVLDVVLRISSLQQQLEAKDQEMFRLQQHITDMQVIPVM